MLWQMLHFTLLGSPFLLVLSPKIATIVTIGVGRYFRERLSKHNGAGEFVTASLLFDNAFHSSKVLCSVTVLSLTFLGECAKAMLSIKMASWFCFDELSVLP